MKNGLKHTTLGEIYQNLQNRMSEALGSLAWKIISYFFILILGGFLGAIGAINYYVGDFPGVVNGHTNQINRNAEMIEDNQEGIENLTDVTCDDSELLRFMAGYILPSNVKLPPVDNTCTKPQ